MSPLTLPSSNVRLAATAGRADYPATLAAAWRTHRAPRAADAPTVVDLFSGCGGASLGFSMAGFRELLAVEWDAAQVATFRHNLSHVPVHEGDIRELSVAQVLERSGLAPGALDVLAASPPCQGFSTAGQRAFADARNGLYREVVRLAAGLRPRALLLENVSGLVKGRMRLHFADALRALRACGYDLRVGLLDAAYFGVPQHRQRVIFVGLRQDLGVAPRLPTAQTRPLTVREALDGLVLDEAERAWLLAAGARCTAYRHWAAIPQGRTLANVTRRGVGFNARKYHLDRPAPTLVRTDGNLTMHGALHPTEPRRFTVREFQRLASFPDEFVFAGDWSNAVHGMGNSVPPLFARALARHVRALLAEAEGDSPAGLSFGMC